MKAIVNWNFDLAAQKLPAARRIVCSVAKQMGVTFKVDEDNGDGFDVRKPFVRFHAETGWDAVSVEAAVYHFMAWQLGRLASRMDVSMPGLFEDHIQVDVYTSDVSLSGVVFVNAVLRVYDGRE